MCAKCVRKITRRLSVAFYMKAELANLGWFFWLYLNASLPPATSVSVVLIEDEVVI